MRTRRTRTAVALAVAAALALTLSACGGKSAQSHKASKALVAFIPSTTDPYIAQWAVGAKQEAAKLGYTITVLEATDENSQAAEIDQELQGAKPAGFLYWPIANQALVGKQDQLNAAAPLVMTNQLPQPGSSFTAYAGVNDILSGQDGGTLLANACAKSTTVTCAGGIIVRFPTGYSAGTDRITGFKQSPAGKYPILQTVDAGGFQETDGYSSTKSVINSLGRKITWVYAETDAIAGGVIKALEEAGRTPGKDVLVSGGTCHGDSTNLLNGKLVGTAIQSGILEGALAVQTMYKYLQTKKVLPGDINLPADPNAPPSNSGSPHLRNFMPNTMVAASKAAFDSTKLWGQTMAFLCNY
jgi:ribose transport system substrate-binding protein